VEHITCDLPTQLIFSNTSVRTPKFPKVMYACRDSAVEGFNFEQFRRQCHFQNHNYKLVFLNKLSCFEERLNEMHN